MVTDSTHENDSNHWADLFIQERRVRLIVAMGVSLALHGSILLCDWRTLPGRTSRQTGSAGLLTVNLAARPLSDTTTYTSAPLTGQKNQSSQNDPPNSSESSTNPAGTLSREIEFLALPVFEYIPAKMLEQRPEIIGDMELYDPVIVELAKQGKFIASVLVNENGKVDAVTVENSSLPESFVEQVIAILMRSRFTPGKLEGQATKSQIRIEVSVTPPG